MTRKGEPIIPAYHPTPLFTCSPKATPVSDPQESVAALFGPEEISDETVTSLQVASGIRARGLEMTISMLGERLELVLKTAWWEVRPTLEMQDLWTVAQVAPDEQDPYGIVMGYLESNLEDLEGSDVDPVEAGNLLRKVRSWDLVTRWAVLRVVSNSIDAAMKRSGNSHVIPNRLIEDEFRKAFDAK